MPDHFLPVSAKDSSLETHSNPAIDILDAIPEEDVWLASQKSRQTRRAYRTDVAHFVSTFGISSPEEIRRIDHKAVIAWERAMRESEGLEASTIRRRLSALSSLFKHLIRYGIVERNPVQDIGRPRINRMAGSVNIS